MLIFERIWALSFRNRATCAINSSRCCCFRIRDRLADSRFDCILFRFLWSIRTCKSSSEPEFRSLVEPEEFPLEEAIEMDMIDDNNAIYSRAQHKLQNIWSTAERKKKKNLNRTRNKNNTKKLTISESITDLVISIISGREMEEVHEKT